MNGKNNTFLIHDQESPPSQPLFEEEKKLEVKLNPYLPPEAENIPEIKTDFIAQKSNDSTNDIINSVNSVPLAQSNSSFVELNIPKEEKQIEDPKTANSSIPFDSKKDTIKSEESSKGDMNKSRENKDTVPKDNNLTNKVQENSEDLTQEQTNNIIKQGYELLENASKAKSEGTELFKANKLNDALSRYSIGDNILSYQNFKPLYQFDMKLFEQLLNLKKEIKLNISLMNLKLGLYKEVITNTTEVITNLDDKSAKAYYRRGISFQKLGIIQNAYDDLKKAYSIEPKEASIQEAYTEVQVFFIIESI